MDGSTLPAVAEELLREIRKAFQETSQVPDDLLLGLKFIFGPSAVPALDLVDQRSVTRLRSPSGRILYQVLGSSGKLYTCYSSCHFCTCPAFGFSVLQKSESLLPFQGDFIAVHGDERSPGKPRLCGVQLRSLLHICPPSPQPLELSCTPGGSIHVQFPGKDNRDTEETEMNKHNAKPGFGALQLKEAAAPAHWRGACNFYSIHFPPF
ncbi:zinc finger SWIM domain-containing protein 7 isoform X1 [Zonotrichia albicollis]|uniref:zinc finger SWIM domain-containing protein 7 isoform X1 n=1 Tax=Zonotrichia albicollis TaxID=44394 RepID=UPI003D80E83D